MDLETALATLREKGKANTAKIYARHGVKDPCYGVSYADIEKLVKQIKQDHRLALGLFASGNHDARVLATKIADPDALSEAEIDAWMRATRDHVIEGAVAGLAARRKDALALALGWMKDEGEWTSAGGWNVIAALAMHGGVPEKEGKRLVAHVEKHIHGEKNRTRYAMNNALISIGGSMEPLRERALEAARKIGKVVVDHGETGCKTPDAVDYIAKMVAHQEKLAARRAANGSPKDKPVKDKPTKAEPAKDKPSKTTTKKAGAGKVVVTNVNAPGYESRLDATKYEAMKKALLRVLPKRAPGLTQAEMFAAVVPHLPEDLFPGGAKAGWWAKSVQLDLEARGVVVRDKTKPLTWRKV